MIRRLRTLSTLSACAILVVLSCSAHAETGAGIGQPFYVARVDHLQATPADAAPEAAYEQARASGIVLAKAPTLQRNTALDAAMGDTHHFTYVKNAKLLENALLTLFKTKTPQQISNETGLSVALLAKMEQQIKKRKVNALLEKNFGVMGIIRILGPAVQMQTLGTDMGQAGDNMQALLKQNRIDGDANSDEGAFSADRAALKNSGEELNEAQTAEDANANTAANNAADAAKADSTGSSSVEGAPEGAEEGAEMGAEEGAEMGAEEEAGAAFV
jgi:hypothetical protein